MERLKQVLHSPLGRRKNGISSAKVFGVSLEELAKGQLHAYPVIAEDANGSFSSANVPFVVDRICRHIFANGIEEEGIFRVNGNSRVMEKLKESFEKHGDADLESADDIYAVAGLLKLFLRELPDAVIPESMTSQFVRCQEGSKRDKAECLRQLKVLIEELPKRHYDLLKYIIRFLVDVAAKDSNKMSPMGLAIVFGPNLFRCSAGIEGLRDQGVTNEIVCKFLSEYATLFGELTEPGPFTIPHIHQNREKRKQPPLRPPPPKIADNSTTLPLPMELNEDLRPTTSLSQEFMERASPFTIADGDGHSSIASPVLSAVASELVTKTISEAVLEHIFSATEVRSIFDHWGECDDMSSRTSTPHSSVHHRRATPANSHTGISGYSRENTELADSYNTSNSSTPQPKPRKHATAVEENVNPQPRPRTQKPSSRPADIFEDNYSQVTEPPKPKPRTKSAPPRHGTLGDTMHYSIDMPVVIRKQAHVDESPDSEEHADPTVTTVTNTINDEFDSIACIVTKLQHFKKPKGPAKRVSRKERGHSTANGDGMESHIHNVYVSADEQNIIYNKKLNNGDHNNNDNLNEQSPEQSAVPRGDVNQLADQPPTTALYQAPAVVVIEADEGAMTPPAVAGSQGRAINALETPDAGGDHILSTTPHGHQIEGLTPEPKLQHRHSADDEQRAAQIKALSKKINTLKKKVKLFEESFEAEHGVKPSTQDKNSKLEIKKALVDLAKSRKELKNLKEQGADNSRVDSIEPPTASAEHAGSRPESVVNIGTSSEPPTMADTLELLLKRLKDKRQEASRADEINTLTRDQVQEEKLAVQKALLHFESIHGRPQTKSEKELMRPLYDRYRQIKKALVTAPISKPQQPSEQNASEKEVAETDATEMLVTQHPELHTEHSIPNGDEEDRGDSPADAGKAARETNLQEMPAPELKSELDKANNTKKKLRKLLRDFEDDFQKENNRKVQREDRGPMETKYQEYKQIKARIKLLEVLLSKQEA